MNFYLRNAWYAAGWETDINGLIRRVLLETPVVIFRDQAGKVHALKDMCSHRYAPLSKGKLCGNEIQCPYHGLRFNTEGQCTHNPHGDGTIAPNSNIERFPVACRHGAVWVWMGEKGACDTELIPNNPMGDMSDYQAVTGSMSIKANYQLVIDNLLDLSHVNYIHPDLRVPNDNVAVRQRTTKNGNSISAFLWRDQALPNGLQKNFWPADKIGDARAHMHWMAASSLFLDVGITDVGADTRGVEVPSFHFLSPAGPYETDYHWAVLRQLDKDNDSLNKKITAMFEQAFGNEDRPIIEAQQENLGKQTDILAMRPFLLAPDGAPVLARKLLDQLIAKEA